MEKGGSLAGRIFYFDTNTPAEDARVNCMIYDPNDLFEGYGTSYYNGYYSSSSSSDSYAYAYGYGYICKTVSFGLSDSQGRYCLTKIPKGGYIIYARSSDSKYYGYYQDNSDYLDPPIILKPGQKLEEIDIILLPILKDDTVSMEYEEAGAQTSSSYGSYGGYYGTSSSVGGYGGYTGNMYGSGYGGYTGNMYGSGYGGYAGYGNYGYAPDQSSQDAPSIKSKPEPEAFVDEPYSYQVELIDPNGWSGLNCRLIEAPLG